MREEFKDLVFEFAKKVSGIDAVQSVVLFGSLARGEADARSDVDILIVFDSPRPVGKIEGRSATSTKLLTGFLRGCSQPSYPSTGTTRV